MKVYVLILVLVSAGAGSAAPSRRNAKELQRVMTFRHAGTMKLAERCDGPAALISLLTGTPAFGAGLSSAAPPALTGTSANAWDIDLRSTASAYNPNIEFSLQIPRQSAMAGLTRDDNSEMRNFAATRGAAQNHQAPAPEADSGTETIDAIAARIDADVITESEVRELAAFQTLVDGSAKPRDEVIRELTDQWIVNGEAETARFPHPSDKDIDTAYAQLAKQFSSEAQFEQRCAQAGLTADSVRRELAAQIYLSRFLDFRFRPAAEVNDADIQKYYAEEFAPQLKAKGEAVPSLDKVQDTIREVLIQRDITKRANQWLDDTRSRLEIDVLPAGGGTQ